MKHTLSVTVAFMIFALGSLGWAQSESYELTCRAKAKEIAAETYRGCITENKKVHIEQLRSDYQQRLKAIKDEYDQEVKKLTGQSADSVDKNTQIEGKNSTKNTNPPANKKYSKKILAKKSLLPAKKKVEKNLPVSDMSTEEVSVQLRPSMEQQDDSSMDIPEPVPVEKLDDLNG